jgi:hypothetical protein
MNLENSVEYVAETIFKYKRGNCQGVNGGGSIDSSGINIFVHCQWCGKRYDDYEPRTPCPNFSFPEFSFIDLMRKLGEKGIEITLRYDSKRDKNNFTLIELNGRICDTDEPFKALCDWLLLYEPKKIT